MRDALLPRSMFGIRGETRNVAPSRVSILRGWLFSAPIYPFICGGTRAITRQFSRWDTHCIPRTSRTYIYSFISTSRKYVSVQHHRARQKPLDTQFTCVSPTWSTGQYLPLWYTKARNWEATRDRNDTYIHVGATTSIKLINNLMGLSFINGVRPRCVYVCVIITHKASHTHTHEGSEAKHLLYTHGGKLQMKCCVRMACMEEMRSV